MRLEPLRVQVQPAAGICCDGRLPLDGLLAWSARMLRLGIAATSLRPDDVVEDEPLPLARRGTTDRWYWAASMSDTRWLARDIGYYNKRYDLTDAVRYVNFGGRSEKVSIGAGSTKNYHQPVYLLLTDRLTWYAVGDVEEVRYLLRPLFHIGKYARMGFGAVGEWTVEPWEHDWSCWRGGWPMRSLPLLDLPTGSAPTNVGTYGIRSPYHHPSSRELCALPLVQLPGAVLPQRGEVA